MSADPWRYVCPACGSTSWQTRQPGAIHSHSDPGNFYCDNCNRSIDALYDKKSGVEVETTVGNPR